MPAQLAGDLAFFGAGRNALPAWMLEEAESDFEVYAVNVPAFQLWERLQTQWRVGGLVGETGLDYGVAFQIMDRMRPVPEDPLQLLDQLRLIESGYLAEMGRKRQRSSSRRQHAGK
ncbi:MAG TPA: hypothetical protein DEG76_02465 [Pseudohongiella sp.]|nr:hypothetical protein [Pseudohongiella sp.]HBX36218.1 hypothetical protein [Pseudohongiella sp.]|tara:strand:- start:12079 stop:12426 length:348 start_codon:yes stop_codon:yes gene_type:complete